jgi:serine/threonine-protein kinase
MLDVVHSADALVRRIRVLVSMPRSSGVVDPEARKMIEGEIRALEAEANPLDTERSEARVRRLAFLRRQHRELIAATDSTRDAASRLEECVAALHNMRLDVVRLRAGTQSLEQLTLLASKAVSLANEVDAVLLAAEDAAGGNAASASPGGAPR